MFFCVIMDRLSSERQKSLKKTGSDWLKFKLVRAGMSEDMVMEMDRSQLLEEVAKIITREQLEEAARVPLPADDTASVASDVGPEALRLKELELEEKRCIREERRAEREADERRAERQREVEERKAEREAEERKAIREAEERRAEREAEERRAAREAEWQKEVKRMELEQTKLTLEIRRIEMQATTEDPGKAEGSEDGDEEPTLRAPKGDNILATQTKRFGDIMRHVLPKIPVENSELPQFFETVEKLFEIYEIPDDVKTKLLIPLLTAQAKALVNRMSVKDLAKYK